VVGDRAAAAGGFPDLDVAPVERQELLVAQRALAGVEGVERLKALDADALGGSRRRLPGLAPFTVSVEQVGLVRYLLPDQFPRATRPEAAERNSRRSSTQ